MSSMNAGDRIAVVFDVQAGRVATQQPLAWLVEVGAAGLADQDAFEVFAAGAPGHPAACACCAARSDAAQALGRLFLRRARGDIPWFEVVQVVARTAGGREAVRTALTCDRLVAGRFREG